MSENTRLWAVNCTVTFDIDLVIAAEEEPLPDDIISYAEDEIEENSAEPVCSPSTPVMITEVSKFPGEAWLGTAPYSKDPPLNKSCIEIFESYRSDLKPLGVQQEIKGLEIEEDE